MKIRLSFDHWRHGLPGCTHAPTTWPWWRLFSVSIVRLGVVAPTTGYRLWVYTRPNVGRTIDLVFDRRRAVALGHFQTWWGSHEEWDGDYTRFWAHGPHFDEQILAACFRATKIVVPWHYRAPRDVRTMLEAAGLDPKNDIPSYGTAHNALDDAKAQALAVIAAFRKLAA